MADQRLVDSRFQKIRQRLKASENQGLPDEALVEMVMSGQDLKPTPRETHTVSIEFLQDQITALLSEEQPNFPLVTCLLQMIDRHEKAEVDMAQTENNQKVEGQAPEIAAQVAAAQAQAQGEAQAQQAAAEQKQKEQAMKLQAKAELDAEKRRHQSAEAELDREYEAQKHEADVALKAAEISANANQPGEVAAPEPDAKQKVAESLNYKDLPPLAQSALLTQVGLPSGGTEKVHPEIMKQKIAASKPKPNGASR